MYIVHLISVYLYAGPFTDVYEICVQGMTELKKASGMTMRETFD
jgi:hypothetical protein